MLLDKVCSGPVSGGGGGGDVIMDIVQISFLHFCSLLIWAEAVIMYNLAWEIQHPVNCSGSNGASFSLVRPRVPWPAVQTITHNQTAVVIEHDQESTVPERSHTQHSVTNENRMSSTTSSPVIWQWLSSHCITETTLGHTSNYSQITASTSQYKMTNNHCGCGMFAFEFLNDF